jgi:hypothetical protein
VQCAMRGDSTRSERCDRVGVKGGSCGGKFSRKDCSADSAPRADGGKWVPGSRLKTLNCSNSPVSGSPSSLDSRISSLTAMDQDDLFLLHQAAVTSSFVQNHETLLREADCRKSVWSGCALLRNFKDFLALTSISVASEDMKLGKSFSAVARD